jgi:hypothetical protein
MKNCTEQHGLVACNNTSPVILCVRIRVALQQLTAGFKLAPGSGAMQRSHLPDEAEVNQQENTEFCRTIM